MTGERIKLVHIWAGADFVQFTGRTLKALCSQGFDIHVICAPGPELASLGPLSGVSVHVLPMERGITPRADLQTLPQLVRLLRKIRPQIVHAHTPKGGLLGMTAAWLAGVPLRIYQMHGLRYETAADKKRMVLLAAERLSCRIAHRVICVSPSVRERALVDKVLAGEKAVLLRAGSAQGVDALRFTPEVAMSELTAFCEHHRVKEDGVHVGFLGRLSRDKGLADLALAWPQIAEKHPGVRLLIAGAEDPTDPPDLKALKQRDDIHFCGLLEDPRGFYASCRVIVLPSFREGLPQVLLEAGAMQLPVVATRVTGTVDAVLDGMTGLLVPPRSPDALAAAACRVLEDTGLASTLGAQARDFVSKTFQFEPLLEELIALYQELLKSCRTGNMEEFSQITP